MANVALEYAEHPEIRDLAQRIISAQEAEIAELKSIKQREYGSTAQQMYQRRRALRR
jgi:uncharacterized protein (DUF305 family)